MCVCVCVCVCMCVCVYVCVYVCVCVCVHERKSTILLTMTPYSLVDLYLLYAEFKTSFFFRNVDTVHKTTRHLFPEDS